MNLQVVLTLLISSTLFYSAPLIFTALGGVFSERGGVVNVGLEGIMVGGAFASTVFNLTFAETFKNITPWLSLIVGALAGLLFAALHALATVSWRANHIISGTVINLLAPAITIFLLKAMYHKGQSDQLFYSFGYNAIPILKDIPVIGPIIFEKTSGPAWIAIIVAFISWFVIFKTRFGLRLRSVGENPQAADTLGLNVIKLRYSGVLISGILGGIGGAIVSQSISLNFSAQTIAGQGFMSLAALIFGRWNPIGAMLAALFFGLSQSLSVVGQQIEFFKSIPTIWLQVAPYLLTIIVLALFFGKSKAPAADGINYIKSE